VEAIVLAGGLGTRLQSVVNNVPKPMALINEKPFLEYILQYLQNSGVKRVILSVGYKWELIKEYFGNKFNSIELIYSIENEPLGTGGAIKKALSKVISSEAYIVNGDTFFNINLSALELSHSSKLQLSLKKMYNFDRYGCVESNIDNIVTNFTEKSYKEVGNINGGVYLTKVDIFDGYELADIFSFEEFMEINFTKLVITTKVFDNYFIDIGIPEDYKRAQSEMIKYR